MGLTYTDLGRCEVERVVYGTAHDGKPYVVRLRLCSEHAGWFEVDPTQPRCALEVGGWMVTKLNPSTWRSLCAMFD